MARGLRPNQTGGQDNALHGKALWHRLEHRLQGLGLGYVAGVNGMHQGQPFGRLHNTEDELPCDTTGLFVHAEGAQIVTDLPLAMDLHGGQIVEDERKIMVDKGADLAGQFDLHHLSMIHKGPFGVLGHSALSAHT